MNFSGKVKKMNALPTGPDGTRSQKGLVKLEKRCQNEMQDVKLLGDRQEILKGMIEDKIRLQSRATENTTIRFFEEMKELEEKKSKEALLLVQK